MFSSFFTSLCGLEHPLPAKAEVFSSGVSFLQLLLSCFSSLKWPWQTEMIDTSRYQVEFYFTLASVCKHSMPAGCFQIIRQPCAFFFDPLERFRSTTSGRDWGLRGLTPIIARGLDRKRPTEGWLHLKREITFKKGDFPTPFSSSHHLDLM